MRLDSETDHDRTVEPDLVEGKALVVQLDGLYTGTRTDRPSKTGIECRPSDLLRSVFSPSWDQPLSATDQPDIRIGDRRIERMLGSKNLTVSASRSTRAMVGSSVFG